MITKWITYNEDGFILQISEIEQNGFTELSLNITESQWRNYYYNAIIVGKLIYSNEELIENPNYIEPVVNEVESILEKREFGQRLIAEVMVETQIEGILQINPQLGTTLMNLTQNLFYALNNGFLIMAIGAIKQIPENSIGQSVNNIIDSVLLLKYRNKIHYFLGYPPVNNYND